jgi:hypothetical protein
MLDLQKHDKVEAIEALEIIPASGSEAEAEPLAALRQEWRLIRTHFSQV